MPISCHFRDWKALLVTHESDSCKWRYSKCPDLYLYLYHPVVLRLPIHRLRGVAVASQMAVYKEDFENERRDKERALSEKESLIKQTTSLLNDLKALQERVC